MPAQRRARQNARSHHATDGSVSRSPLRVVIVAVPPMRTLDVFGPAEVFGDANWLRGGDPAYKVHLISACADRVVTNHLGTPVHTDRTYREYSGPIDTLLVAGCMGPRELNYEPGFLEWLRLQSTRARRFGSICTGAFVLAKAGLLDGRRATTHWNWATELAQDYPQVAVDPDPIYIRDGSCYTSAGVTAGIDLCLALVEQDLGRPLALRIAQMMVVFLQRPGGQSQFSATLAAQIESLFLPAMDEAQQPGAHPAMEFDCRPLQTGVTFEGMDMKSVQEVLDALKVGHFDDLIGMAEGDWFEAKQSPYVLDSLRAKQEFTKDVSALANADGGVIVIGFRTERKIQSAGDCVAEVCPFPAAMIDPDQYRKILEAWVHPPLDTVDIHVFHNSATPDKSVAAIVIDPRVTAPLRPFLVTKVFDDDERVIGTMLGYFERRQDRVPSMSAARLQEIFASGQRFGLLHDRLTSIESSIQKMGEPILAKQQAVQGVPAKVFQHRLKQARLIVQRDDRPILYFTARAETQCEFPTLFDSRSAMVVRLIDDLPQLRPNGFGLWANKRSEIVQGELRRSFIPGARILELWRDGLFIFIGEGDEDLLAWAAPGGPNRPIRINNFVLAETTLVFCWLMRFIFFEARPLPRVLRLSVGFDNLTRANNPAQISDVPEGTIMLSNGPKAAPRPEVEVYELAEWDDYDAEVIAARLISDVYNWFGHESSDVPYVDRSGPKPRLHAETITGKPLPSTPFKMSADQ